MLLRKNESLSKLRKLPQMQLRLTIYVKEDVAAIKTPELCSLFVALLSAETAHAAAPASQPRM